jgi:hypothetical protein
MPWCRHVAGRKIGGQADFQSSLTGETHGNPIVFNYAYATEALKDGTVSATCQNRQANEQG